MFILYITQHRAISTEEQCYVSLATIETMSSCPSNEAELHLAKKRKPCEHIAEIQNCTERDKFKYHCVLNAWENKTVAVCAPEIISKGKTQTNHKGCLICCKAYAKFYNKTNGWCSLKTH